MQKGLNGSPHHPSRQTFRRGSATFPEAPDLKDLMKYSRPPIIFPGDPL